MAVQYGKRNKEHSANPKFSKRDFSDRIFTIKILHPRMPGMEQEAFEHLLYRIGNVRIRSYPYPHFHIEEIFPDDFYQDLLANLPDPSLYHSLSKTKVVTEGAYKERFMMGLK